MKSAAVAIDKLVIGPPLRTAVAIDKLENMQLILEELKDTLNQSTRDNLTDLAIRYVNDAIRYLR